MTLLHAIKNEQIRSVTENGAYAHNTSGSAVTDAFFMAGALRERKPEDIARLFLRALQENETAALKLAFYTRDIRGGLGERRTARIFFQTLAVFRPKMMRRNLRYIPEYGRWDDLLCLLETPLKNDVIRLIRTRLREDQEQMRNSRPVSLLAKWLPSVNASSRETVRTARSLAEALGMSERTYRKTLSALRNYINITERFLSAQAYDQISYPSVPSYAMKLYRNAFQRHDPQRFESWLQDVREHRSSLNSRVLYPYDIAEQYLYRIRQEDPVLEAQWDAMPDFVRGSRKCLVMADVSGSMYGRPLAASVSLAIWFAQRNQGIFHNRFLTFSRRPELVEIRGNSLFEKIESVRTADWDMNTDLEAAFRLILSAAVRHHVPQEDMPDSLVILSDMEIDVCTYGLNQLFSDAMKNRFAAHGYVLPKVVFWNLNARRNTFHAAYDTENILLVSGQSASVFEHLADDDVSTPYEYMMKILNSEAYLKIC